MKIQIQTAANGWFIEVQDPESQDKENAYYVFSHHDHDDGKSEAEAFANLLWEIKTLIGPQESRYSAHRVMVQIEPGDKHEGSRAPYEEPVESQEEKSEDDGD